jgi:hypothetical protein
MKEDTPETGYWVAVCKIGDPIEFHKVVLEDVTPAEGGYGYQGYRASDPLKNLKKPKREKVFVSPLRLSGAPQVDTADQGKITGTAWFHGNSKDRLKDLKQEIFNKIEISIKDLTNTLNSFDKDGD